MSDLEQHARALPRLYTENDLYPVDSTQVYYVETEGKNTIVRIGRRWEIRGIHSVHQSMLCVFYMHM